MYSVKVIEPYFACAPLPRFLASEKDCADRYEGHRGQNNRTQEVRTETVDGASGTELPGSHPLWILAVTRILVVFDIRLYPRGTPGNVAPLCTSVETRWAPAPTRRCPLGARATCRPIAASGYLSGAVRKS